MEPLADPFVAISLKKTAQEPMNVAARYTAKSLPEHLESSEGAPLQCSIVAIHLRVAQRCWMSCWLLLQPLHQTRNAQKCHAPISCQVSTSQLGWPYVAAPTTVGVDKMCGLGSPSTAAEVFSTAHLSSWRVPRRSNTADSRRPTQE
eukprot:5891314-Amphidinium_carterae.2